MTLKKQRGVTLVELMIALLIGVILTSGVLYSFQLSKKSYALIEAEATLHDNALFTIETLNSIIRLAGNTTAHNQTFTDITIGGNAGDIVNGSNGPDTISVWYEGGSLGGNVTDCLGNTVAPTPVGGPSAPVQSTFQLSAINPDGTFNLECARTNAAGATSTQPLISGVTDMQITYGIDPDNDGTINQYVDMGSTDLDTVAERLTILAVRVQLTLQTTNATETDTRVFNTGIHLRNK